MVAAELDPARVRFRQREADLGSRLGQMDVETDLGVDREDGNSTLSTGTPESGSGPLPEMIPVPDSSSLSVQLPTSRDTLDIQQPPEPPFDRTRAPSQAPRADGAQQKEFTRGQLHDQCSQRGYRKKESKAVLNTRLTTMDAAEAKSNLDDVT